MARFSAIDLSGLEPPDIIETLDYEAILAELKADAGARMTELGLDFDVTDLESDPAIKILEVTAAREAHLRARVNGAAKALLLALAQKNDLAHIGALFSVDRAQTGTDDAGDPIYETDARFRERIALAPEAFSTAGPAGAYVFQAMAADPLVKDVGILVPEDGHIDVYPLSSEGDGTAPQKMRDAIRARLMEEDVRPLTDIVNVRVPPITTTAIAVRLMIPDGPDPTLLKDMARANLEAYAASRHKVGYNLRFSGIYQAAHVAGVDNVIIVEPAAEIDPGDSGAVFVDNVTVEHEIVSP